MKYCKKILMLAMAFLMSFSVFACANNDAKEYIVKFELDGGAMAESISVNVEAGNSITLPTPTKSGFTFSGWFEGATLAGIGGASLKPTKDVALTAKWEKPNYATINRTRAIEYAKSIHEKYWNSSTEKSTLTPDGGVPFLWPYTEQVSMANAVIELLEKTDSDYAFFEKYLRELVEGLRFYRAKTVNVGLGERWERDGHIMSEFGVNNGSADSYAIYPAGRGNDKDSAVTGFGGVFFDDNVWVAKEFYYAYKNLGDVKYLNEAINIMNWIIGEGYETAKGMNGVYWNWGSKFLHPGETNDSKNASLNACSSAPGAMMLVKLYEVMGEEKLNGKFDAIKENYLTTAKKIYNFLWEVLLDKEYSVIYDKVFINLDKDNALVKGIVDQQQLPYNTGTFMTLGAELYNTSVKLKQTSAANLYKERNKLVAAGSDRKFANTLAVAGQYSYNKNSWFTSFLLEGYMDILPTDENCNIYIEHMRSALDYAFVNNRAQDGLVSPAWIVGWSEFTSTSISEDNPRQILLQSANAHCYAMLAKHYSK